MQCYHYLAAVSAVANAIDTMPGERHHMPHSVIAEWMEQNGIDAEELLAISGDEVRALVAQVVQRDHPELPHAA